MIFLFTKRKKDEKTRKKQQIHVLKPRFYPKIDHFWKTGTHTPLTPRIFPGPGSKSPVFGPQIYAPPRYVFQNCTGPRGGHFRRKIPEFPEISKISGFF